MPEKHRGFGARLPLNITITTYDDCLTGRGSLENLRSLKPTGSSDTEGGSQPPLRDYAPKTRRAPSQDRPERGTDAGNRRDPNTGGYRSASSINQTIYMLFVALILIVHCSACGRPGKAMRVKTNLRGVVRLK